MHIADNIEQVFAVFPNWQLLINCAHHNCIENEKAETKHKVRSGTLSSHRFAPWWSISSQTYESAMQLLQQCHYYSFASLKRYIPLPFPVTNMTTFISLGFARSLRAARSEHSSTFIRYAELNTCLASICS